MGAVLREIVIDCNDAEKVAGFWGEVLGWQVQQQGDFLWMSESGAPFPDLVLVFARVPEPKTVKNRVHLDLRAVDVAAEAERLVGLGARVLAEVEDWVVLADPEGNELCVLGRRADQA